MCIRDRGVFGDGFEAVDQQGFVVAVRIDGDNRWRWRWRWIWGCLEHVLTSSNEAAIDSLLNDRVAAMRRLVDRGS